MPGSLLTISPCLCSLSQYEIVITTYSILAKEIPIQKEETDVPEDCLVQVTEMCKNDFKRETRNYSVEMKTIFKDRQICEPWYGIICTGVITDSFVTIQWIIFMTFLAYLYLYRNNSQCSLNYMAQKQVVKVVLKINLI